MNVELPLPCQHCGARDPVSVPIAVSWWEWRCEACGRESSMLSHEGFTLGLRVLEKAKTEYLSEQDYSTSIVFSAMAFEVELARLFFKWRRIDTRMAEWRELSDEELDVEFRGAGRSIAEKIAAVARLLVGTTLDAFVDGTDLAEKIEKGYPSLHVGSLAPDFQQAVFWPRNRILHAARFDYDQEEAKGINNMAALGLELLKAMDGARRHRGAGHPIGQPLAPRVPRANNEP